MIKIFLILNLIILCTGCTSITDDLTYDIPEYEELLPDLTPEFDIEQDFEVEQELEVFNEYHELLLSYILIDVTNLNKITLPNYILDEKIIWKNNTQEITYLTGNNITYYITATIGKQSKNFNITFKNNIVDEIFQQDLLFKYLFVTDSKKLGTSMNPNKIIIHNTANTAAALNEVLYLNSTSNTSSVSFHFAVDDVAIYQAVPNNIYAHHAGNLSVNKESIGIEIAKSMLNDNTIKNKAIYNAQRLIRLLQMSYNIDDVLTHKDITGKHCPHDILDRYGLDNFYKELNNFYYSI